MVKPTTPLSGIDPARLILAGRSDLRAGRPDAAIRAFANATRQLPQSVDAWTGLGNALFRAGRPADGAGAHLRAVQAASRDAAFAPIAQAMKAGRLGEAYGLLTARYRAEPQEAPTLRLLAQIALRAGKHEESFALLMRLVELAPALEDAHDMVRSVLGAMPLASAHAAVDALLARAPDHPGYRSLKAMLLERGGDYAGAVATLRAVLGRTPASPGGWIALGDVLEMTGETDEAIAAYRQSLALEPANGRAWWSLANIKAYRFPAEDIEAMRQLLARADLLPRERAPLAFALGKALEDAGDAEGAFAHYREGNALRRGPQGHDHARTQDLVERLRRFFTPAFFAARAGQGDPAPDPIFIVGLPRSGSTLVEHMLAAHPAIEGTMELPDLPRAAMRLDGPQHHYPEALADLDAAALARIGHTYLAETRPQRHTAKPCFIDKLPANFLHVGLIRTVLPNAKVIDVRRHPLACGWSCYRQYFASGFPFANDLTDIGLHYHAYAELMAHWDAAIPGFVHRVQYEDLVADPEGQLRALLDYLGLPFDPACLAAHESRRAVRTPSASQVRQPVYRDRLESWRPFEPWLGPLKTALGDLIDS